MTGSTDGDRLSGPSGRRTTDREPGAVPQRTPRAAWWFGIASLACLLLWGVDMCLGDLTAVRGDALDNVPGKPIATAALFGMICCYFGMIVCSWHVRALRVRNYAMLTFGLLAVLNPISALVLYGVMLCGWSGCVMS